MDHFAKTAMATGGFSLGSTSTPSDSAVTLISDVLNHLTALDSAVGLIETALGLPATPVSGDKNKSYGLLSYLYDARRLSSDLRLRVEQVTKALGG